MKAKKALLCLHALAQDSRLAVYRLLAEEGGDTGMCAGTIAQRLGIPPTTMSFHLSQLKHAALVEAHKEGRMVIYVANRKKARKLAAYILGKETLEDDDDELQFDTVKPAASAAPASAVKN